MLCSLCQALRRRFILILRQDIDGLTMSILALKPATDLLVLFCKNRLETVVIVIHYTGRPENDRQYCLVRETESRISMGPFHVSIWLCFLYYRISK